MRLISCVLLSLSLVLALGHPQRGKFYHPDKVRTKRSWNNFDRPFENKTEYWQQQAQATLNEKLGQKLNKNVAKNVILFLGDGMSLPTLTAARAYIGQLEGAPGEETVLSFEEFPHTGLSKTYCVDSQVADSACSATAYLCGIKGNYKTIGVNANVALYDWQGALNQSHSVSSIGRWSQLAGKKTGVVTTSTVTCASPSGVFANTANRYWESDKDVKDSGLEPGSQVKDIASQLIRGETGRNLDVILGGGRVKFLPEDHVDEEGSPGERLDGVNLIDEWKKRNSRNGQYVWNRDELLNLDGQTEKVLGLFESGYTKYNLDREENDPSLTEMTETAIRLLEKGPQGYFLFVEGGRIDHAHHDCLAVKALDETKEFSDAIRRAREITDSSDTLIVVTSDHAHTMSLSGYADRGTNIFGSPGLADDNIPLATLSYANGPGYRPEVDGKRYDMSKDDTTNKDYLSVALAPLDSEKHGGDDVAIFANGPWAHLFTGVLEQNAIPHFMAFASCVGNGATACDNDIH